MTRFLEDVDTPLITLATLTPDDTSRAAIEGGIGRAELEVIRCHGVPYLVTAQVRTWLECAQTNTPPPTYHLDDIPSTYHAPSCYEARLWRRNCFFAWLYRRDRDMYDVFVRHYESNQRGSYREGISALAKHRKTTRAHAYMQFSEKLNRFFWEVNHFGSRAG